MIQLLLDTKAEVELAPAEQMSLLPVRLATSRSAAIN
jgi:hypothetical protein